MYSSAKWKLLPRKSFFSRPEPKTDIDRYIDLVGFQRSSVHCDPAGIQQADVPVCLQFLHFPCNIEIFRICVFCRHFSDKEDRQAILGIRSPQLFEKEL